PGIPAHVVNAQPTFPTQQPPGQARVGVDLGDIPGPAIDDLVRDLPARRALERAHQFQHAHPAAGAEVDRRASIAALQVLDRVDVGPRQVDDMDVVAYAGAIHGRVVTTEHLQALAATDRHLANEGHQVVGHATRVLADEPRRV